MKLEIHYFVKTDTLHVRMKIHGLPRGDYDMGMQVDPDKFDSEKQICGDTRIQAYMERASRTLQDLYQPGITPLILWRAYLAKVGSDLERDHHLLEEAFTYYLTQCKISDNTRSNFTYTKNKVAATELLKMNLRDITPALLLKFLNSLTGLEDSTKWNTFVQIKTVINRYIKDHHLNIEHTLNGLIKKPAQQHTVVGEEEYLTLDEVRTLLAVNLSDRPKLAYARDMFCIMCFTGMAIGDLVRFTPDWIGEDGKYLIYNRTKRGRRSEVPIFPISYELIHRHTWPCKISDRTMQYHCEDISELVGRKVTPHTGRHSWGCIALELGFSIESVSKMLGHSSIKITQDLYAKVTRQKIEREKLEIHENTMDLMKTL